MDRQSLLPVILGVCVVNGIFSPYLNIAVAVAAVLMPELFPRTVEWVLFWSSILLSTATLLLSGVPAALYERFVEGESLASMWIWLAGAGTKRGFVLGKSDQTGSAPLENPVHPIELVATIYHAVGINPQTIVYNHLNQPRELVKAEPVSKLFA